MAFLPPIRLSASPPNRQTPDIPPGDAEAERLRLLAAIWPLLRKKLDDAGSALFAEVERVEGLAKLRSIHAALAESDSDLDAIRSLLAR